LTLRRTTFRFDLTRSRNRRKSAEMPSPSNAFQSFTTPEIYVALAEAKDQVVNGQWDSVSGGGKSGHKVVVNPLDLINEINAELRRRGLLPVKPHRVQQVLHYPCFPNGTVTTT
jgi:hypothetical protein